MERSVLMEGESVEGVGLGPEVQRDKIILICYLLSLVHEAKEEMVSLLILKKYLKCRF